MIKVAMKKVLSKAKQIGCEIEIDQDCQCYRATAPAGKRWELGLHELVFRYGSGSWSGATKAEARQELLTDISDRQVEDCDDPRCDWCRNRQ